MEYFLIRGGTNIYFVEPFRGSFFPIFPGVTVVQGGINLKAVKSFRRSDCHPRISVYRPGTSEISWEIKKFLVLEQTQIIRVHVWEQQRYAGVQRCMKRL